MQTQFKAFQRRWIGKFTDELYLISFTRQVPCLVHKEGLTGRLSTHADTGALTFSYIADTFIQSKVHLRGQGEPVPGAIGG